MKVLEPWLIVVRTTVPRGFRVERRRRSRRFFTRHRSFALSCRGRHQSCSLEAPTDRHWIITVVLLRGVGSLPPERDRYLRQMIARLSRQDIARRRNVAYDLEM